MNRKRTLVSRFRVVALASAIGFTVAQPAQALFGVGDIVLDPSNLAQNILTAARTLEQINNQVQQLQNEANMLINQARNLERLDFNSVNRLRSALATTPSEQRPLLNGMVQYQTSRSSGWVVIRIFSRSKRGSSMRSSMWVKIARRTGKSDGASRSSSCGSTRP